MTAIAAASPHAWFPLARDADEIVTASPDNRMVAYPYTKLMTSIMDVDMAAALVLASAAKADALGIPEERRVYLRGAAYAEDPAHVAGHPELWRSPAMAAAAGAALAGAGIGADEVAHLDLYSCFASSVCFALDALGISEGDTRAVTQTGGLPYHGGPGSNYMTHALAAMVETLRNEPGSYGVTSGVGMHMQKHAYGVWSTDPGAGTMPDVAPAPATTEPLAIVEAPEGKATVATYTVLHGRDGGPERAVLDLRPARRRPLLRAARRRGRRAGGVRGRRVDRAHRHADARRRDQPRCTRLAPARAGPLVAGLDGAPGGWVVVTVGRDDDRRGRRPGWCQTCTE